MAENSAIEWTDATVNFWWGCTKVGPGCDHCYAETWAKRTGHDVWGVGASRRRIKGAEALILKLQNGASWFYADHDRRRRVFVQSMSDLFDTEVPIEWFADAWRRIAQCDSLVIQAVTKRVSVVEKRLAAIGVTTWPTHAGLVISVVNQEEADRDVPRLLALKAKLGIPWVGLSMEPLLGPVDIAWALGSWPEIAAGFLQRGHFAPSGETLAPLDWIIVGGESGPGARPMHPDWARSLRDQCSIAGVSFLFKQWGEYGTYGGEGGVEGGWLDPDGHYYGGPTSWPPVTDERRAYMIRWGKKRAGRLLDGVTHDGFPG